MKTITLTWRQVEAVKQQIKAAEEGRVLGHIGKITTDEGFAVDWNRDGVELGVPDSILDPEQEE